MALRLRRARRATPQEMCGRPRVHPLPRNPRHPSVEMFSLGSALEKGGRRTRIKDRHRGRRCGHVGVAYSRTLKQDPTFRVDRCGKTFVQGPAPPAPPDGNEASATANGASIQTVPSDVFALSHDLGRTARSTWTSMARRSRGRAGTRQVSSIWTQSTRSVTPLDGDYATFSPTEQANIYQIWQSVSGGLRSFDVNVTTAPPPAECQRTNSQDTVFGTKALITDTTAIGGGSGGIAFLASFDATNSAYYQPAFVFQRGLETTPKRSPKPPATGGPQSRSEHAGTTAHGGVAANDTTTKGRAPGRHHGASYFKPVTQFSSGQYQYSSNNQDDFAVMATNGVQQLADDYGDTLATATTLSPGTPANPNYPRLPGGFLHLHRVRRHKCCRHACGGRPDLDTRLRIYDGSQTLVATIDPAVAMTDASTATGLNATYSLQLHLARTTRRLTAPDSGTPSPTDTQLWVSRRVLPFRCRQPHWGRQRQHQLNSGATVGFRTGASLASTGGTAPVTWTKESGNLPPGVGLAGDAPFPVRQQPPEPIRLSSG